MDDPSIRPAAPEEAATVASIITLALAGDPVFRWATPDPAKYLAMMPDLANAFGGNGFRSGSVHLSGNGAAAAMWLPPGVEPDVGRMAELNAEYAAGDRLPELGALIDEMARYHPDEPHWYLPLIGVDPAHQGSGLGSALLRHALARIDADGLPAYLESSNSRNVGLFERHGFERLGVIRAGSSPPLVPMLRRPR